MSEEKSTPSKSAVGREETPPGSAGSQQSSESSPVASAPTDGIISKELLAAFREIVKELDTSLTAQITYVKEQITDVKEQTTDVKKQLTKLDKRTGLLEGLVVEEKARGAAKRHLGDDFVKACTFKSIHDVAKVIAKANHKDLPSSNSFLNTRIAAVEKVVTVLEALSHSFAMSAVVAVFVQSNLEEFKDNKFD
jgi:hypothetical protein